MHRRQRRDGGQHVPAPVPRVARSTPSGKGSGNIQCLDVLRAMAKTIRGGGRLLRRTAATRRARTPCSTSMCATWARSSPTPPTCSTAPPPRGRAHGAGAAGPLLVRGAPPSWPTRSAPAPGARGQFQLRRAAARRRCGCHHRAGHATGTVTPWALGTPLGKPSGPAPVPRHKPTPECIDGTMGRSLRPLFFSR